DRAVPPSRFAAGFDDVLAETSTRIAAWWSDINATSLAYQPSDFGIEAEQWVEGADEMLYRVAVAAALAFRLDRDRAGVIAAFAAPRSAAPTDSPVPPHRTPRPTPAPRGAPATPAAADATAPLTAARAARRAVPTGPADEILASFALSAGCAYDCAHRKTCDF